MYHADLLGSIAARILGIKAIVWGIRHSTLEPSKTKKSTILIAKLLSRLSSWLPARIAVCAESAMDEHEALGYDRDKMCFIPNGYDLADFNSRIEEARSLRAKWGVASNIALIGTVGRYHPDKDYNNFLLALAILHARNIPLSCVFVGTNLDNNNKELVEKIKSLRLEESVVLLGQRMDIPAVMSALDLHILSSACEGFPNVVAEAMACETPCVVTDVGDAAYIVGDTGWVVPPHDPKALADSIQQALYMKEQPKWHQLCVSARARIEQEFGIEKMVAGYHELWNEIL
jgi:glycosyltransferase involved in cell wall biosynthesis